MAMKKTCNGCKALVKNITGLGCVCELKHPIQSTKTLYGSIDIEYRPLEECEKPLTYKELVNLQLIKYRK